jgi:competence protein ComGC
MKKIILSLLVFLVFISGLLVYLVPPIIKSQGKSNNTVDYTFNLMITPFHFNFYPDSWYLPNIQILILGASVIMVLGLIIFISFGIKYSLLIPVWVLLIDNIMNISYTLFNHFRFSVSYNTINNLSSFKLLLMNCVWIIISIILLKIINSLTLQKQEELEEQQ